MSRTLASAYLFALATALGAVGCDSDGTDPSDASSGMDGGTTGCAGASDGTSCGSGVICVGGACVESACGDGFVDGASGEECDDGNETAFDGCEPVSCLFTCHEMADCDDGQPCNGAETCSASAHVCEAGEALPEGTPCTRPGSPNGVCRGTGDSATCADPGCGNGVTDGTEDCDDGNTVDGDGCDNDCTFSCTMDAECQAIDMNVCDGMDTCDTATHTCGPGTPLDCDDGVACTDDSCDPVAGCQNVDNGMGDFWYADCDDDGYAFNDTGAERSCMGPPASAPSVCGGGGVWTMLRPIGADVDCLDSNPDVHPGSTAFHTTAIPGALDPVDFDYNCDGVEELERGVAAAGVCRCTGDWYYDDDPPPVCGQRQTYKWDCRVDGSGSCVGFWSRTSASEIVACR